MVIRLIVLIVFQLVLTPLLHCKQQATYQQRKDRSKIAKIVWVYWDSGYESAHAFTQMCINNMDYYVKESGWDFRFLTKHNFTNYISKEGQDRVQEIISRSKYQITVQRISDIYRFILLYQNGGMWLDANSFFTNDLAWIDNIEKELSPYNRISKDPDLITFTYNSMFGGNKTRVIDDAGHQVYLFPGIECWCMIAKPYSKYLTDILQNLLHSLTLPRAQLDQQNKQLGILYSQQNDPYFLTANYQHQTVLQKKQKEIDLHPQKFTTKYSIDYYKIWSIDALSSAFAIQQFNDWKIGPIAETLFYHSMDSFSDIHNTTKYLVKFTGHFYPQLNDLLPHVQLLTCLDVMDRIPDGSIIYRYLFQHSLSMPLVHAIITANNQAQTQCRILSTSQYHTILLIAFAFAVLLILLNYLLFSLIRATEDNNQQLIYIQHNDQ